MEMYAFFFPYPPCDGIGTSVCRCGRIHELDSKLRVKPLTCHGTFVIFVKSHPESQLRWSCDVTHLLSFEQELELFPEFY